MSGDNIDKIEFKINNSEVTLLFPEKANLTVERFVLDSLLDVYDNKVVKGANY